MYRDFQKFSYFLLVFFLCACFNLTAQIVPDPIFTDNMVLQQNADVPIWGKAKPNSKITLETSWDSKKYSAKVDAEGKWTISLKTPKYGGPYEILFGESQTFSLKNILIGDVWLCSGQSNMEMPLAGWGKIKDYESEIQNADYPQIRLLQIAKNTSEKPLTELKAPVEGWRICSPETIADFSSVAYFFGRKLYQEEQIPIGLIHSSWGGTVIEAWTSSGALKEIHDFDAVLAEMQNGTQQDMQQHYDDKLKNWKDSVNQVDPGMNAGNPKWVDKDFDDAAWKTMELPNYWETTALPDVDGLVWFRKKITLDKTAIDGDFTLSFVADDDDDTWFNGHPIGSTTGWDRQRQYQIPAAWIKDGENTISIRIFDSGGNGGIYGDPKSFYLKTSTSTIPLSGDWKYKLSLDLKDAPAKPYLPSLQNQPTMLYNAMIYPLRDVKIRGTIWYQGESNADRAEQYKKLFPLMIKDWRETFNDPELPFYFVQLANFMQKSDSPTDTDWARLRDAQRSTLSLPHTGMAVAIDIGEADDIHPKNKQDVGDRLARIALAKVYGEKIEYSGPQYKNIEKDGNKIQIYFDHANGLKAKKNHELKGFAVAGSDGKFFWAKAKINGDHVVISSPEVKKPEAVRYNWANNPDGNLYNAADLPASPFRTDNWEMK